EEGERHRDRDGDADDDHAVLHVGPEEGHLHRVAEVLQGGVAREPGRRQRDDLAIRLERRRDHPEDGEHHQREDGQADGVSACLLEPHVSSPIFTILRTYTTLSAATQSSISTEIAAPRPKSVLW